jgi:hypothetical protein
MKHLNLKIALLSFGLLLAINQSNANESVLSSTTNSSVDTFIYLAKADKNDGKKVGVQDDEEDQGKWWESKCKLGDEEKDKGKLCKSSGDCVTSHKECKDSSPST